jgi:hypothetical protein
MTNIAAELRAMGTSNLQPDLERMDSLLLSAADEIETNRAALKVAQQSLIELSHAQEVGPSWYTRGENGMYQQVYTHLRRGLEAVQGALGPYDDNGQYLKEKPAAEPSGGLPIRHPSDKTKFYFYAWKEFDSLVFQPNWEIDRIWRDGEKLCFIAGPAQKPGEQHDSPTA